MKIIVAVFVTAVVIRYYVFQPFQVEGSSMEPQLRSGEFLLVDKLSYRFRPPKRGEIIVFRYPRDPRIDYVKRIIALPGETVQLKNGQVYINQQLLKEPYLDAEEITAVANRPELPYQIVLDEGEYFVLGDNRRYSSDSREWGPLKISNIIGRSSLILYPRQSFKAVASPDY